MCVHTATQATVYYRTNGKWPDLTLFHRLSSSSHNLPLPRHLLREEGIIVRALSVYWHYRTYRIATKTNFITSAFTVRWMSSSHHTNKHCFTVPDMPTSSQSLPKKTNCTSFVSHENTVNGRKHFALRKTKSFVSVQMMPLCTRTVDGWRQWWWWRRRR